MSGQHRDDPPEARRYVWMWVVALVLLTAATLYLQREQPETPEELAELGLAPTPTRSVPPSRRPAPQQPGDEASALASRVPEVQAEVECWSGFVASELAACPPFTGEPALRYVFPALDEAGGCLSLPTSGTKTASVRCPVEVDGTEAEATYSEFTSHQALLDYYAAKYDAPSGRSGDLVLYGPAPVGDQGAVQGTATYAQGGRWSVSFRGEDEELTRRVLDTLEVRTWAALTAAVAPQDLDRTDLNDP